MFDQVLARIEQLIALLDMVELEYGVSCETLYATVQEFGNCFYEVHILKFRICVG